MAPRTRDTCAAPPLVTGVDIAAALRAAGLRPGGVLLVHAALSPLGHVVGGAEAVVLALREAVGPDGTLMAPAQSWTNLDPASGVHDRPEADWPAIRAGLPGYDPATTPSDRMGRVAEVIRTWPGARRSPHPARSWAALGPEADALTAIHDAHDPHGPGSPLGRARERRASILLLGVGYGACTALHLGETLTARPGDPIKRHTSWIRTATGRLAVDYTTPAFDAAPFPRIGAAFERVAGLGPHPLGAGHLRLIPMAPLVDFAVEWLGHARGVSPRDPSR
ncbi:AAC(3) family N-acetyltransferase [Palleronia sediminis]|uniref:Aminoglycoside N(3)-acetyltransferase n=1 Tax=Palleronia sediminis TaxID=2547833 RepID=A0A4V3B8T7_9RHOB|nr:AAC(3) family N-acetyltransferase [Palleronia sediminis]TDL76289.1 AAC(3) family N-acetyltransferase [Palleronia sediminis]